MLSTHCLIDSIGKAYHRRYASIRSPGGSYLSLAVNKKARTGQAKDIFTLFPATITGGKWVLQVDLVTRRAINHYRPIMIRLSFVSAIEAE